ncbi:MAG: ABC transporter ATP-binding protein, partial [Gemmatimonadota bacterium]|nr:ABC transporter ATP-binding protein [Gemmatimonadota bacterium]
RGLSLAVAHGEHVVIVGPSGSGKTSLLRAIAGLTSGCAGSVWVDGRSVTAEPPERRRVVYLHQTPVLFPHLSVFENVAFPLRVRGMSRGAANARVDEALAAVRLGDLAGRRPRTLSGGQAHRVALARAVVADPAVLLLDEPLTGLDPELRRDVRAGILEMAARARAAVVVVSHDLEEAGLLADRVAVLSDGGIGQIGTPRDVFARPATAAIARFLGIANWFRGQIRDEKVTCVFGEFCSPADDAAVGPVAIACGTDALRIDRASAVSGIVQSRHFGVDRATVTVRIGSTELSVRVDPRCVPEAGESVGVVADFARLLVYPAGPEGSDSPA